MIFRAVPRAWVLAILACAILLVPSAHMGPLGPATGVQVAALTARPASTSVWSNYSTANSTNVRSVVLSPSGNLVAASTDDRKVLVFQAPFSNPLTPIMNITLPQNVSSMVITDTRPGGGAYLLVADGGFVAAYNVTSGSPAPFWRINHFSIPNPSAPWWAGQVAVSTDGSVFAVVTSYWLSGQAGFNFTYFRDFVQQYGLDQSGYAPIDLHLSSDGTEAVVGTNVHGSQASVLIYSNAGPVGSWPAPISNSTIQASAISGDGNVVFMATRTALLIADPHTITTTGTTLGIVKDSNANPGPLLGVNFTGQSILMGQGNDAYFFNATAQGGFSPPGGLMPSWSAVYSTGNTVTNASLATSNSASNYFVLGVGRAVNWFYWYPGMPDSPSASWQTTTMPGSVLSTGLSSNGVTMAVGSAWSGTRGDELSILTAPTGVPAPAAPVVSVQVLTPKVFDTSASATISWTESTATGITSYSVQVSPLQPSSGAYVPPVKDLPASTTTWTVGGLPFSTNYTVTVTALAYAGARVTSSSQVIFETPAAPAVPDPFLVEEVAALALLAVGVVAFLLFRHRGTKPKTNASKEPPSGAASGPGAQGADYPR